MGSGFVFQFKLHLIFTSDKVHLFYTTSANAGCHNIKLKHSL